MVAVEKPLSFLPSVTSWVKMPEDTFHIFSLLLRCFYSTEIKLDSGLWIQQFRPTSLLFFNVGISMVWNSILISYWLFAKEEALLKSWKRNPLMPRFMRNSTITKQHACENTTWELLSPPVPVSMASACRRECKNHKDATLWSAACTAGKWKKETRVSHSK